MPNNLTVKKNLQRLKAFHDPLLDYYFERVQRSLKNIIQKPPYNIPEEKVQEFNDLFFTNEYVNKNGINDIVSDCFEKEDEFDVCAKKLLDKFFKQFHANFMSNDMELPVETELFSEKNIIKFSQYLNENKKEDIQLDGKNGFFILLGELGDSDIDFVFKSNIKHYNTNNYTLFFYTENIKDKEDMFSRLEIKTSLEKTYHTLKDNQNIQNIGFYLTVEGFTFKYGLYDITDKKLLNTGKFKGNTKILRKISTYQTANSIKKILSNTNLKNLYQLHNIKDSFKKYLKEKEVTIVNDRIIRKKFEYSDFKNENIPHFKLQNTLDNWVFKHKWNSKVHPYIDMNEENIIFYIKVK